jgi:hypothetical protein
LLLIRFYIKNATITLSYSAHNISPDGQGANGRKRSKEDRTYVLLNVIQPPALMPDKFVKFLKNSITP